jgi:hypothetical protein
MLSSNVQHTLGFKFLSIEVSFTCFMTQQNEKTLTSLLIKICLLVKSQYPFYLQAAFIVSEFMKRLISKCIFMYICVWWRDHLGCMYTQVFQSHADMCVKTFQARTKWETVVRMDVRTGAFCNRKIRQDLMKLNLQNFANRWPAIER